MGRFAFILSLVVGLAIPASVAGEAKTHDGFHLQVGGGLGGFKTSATVYTSDLSYSGMSIPTQEISIYWNVLLARSQARNARAVPLLCPTAQPNAILLT